MNAFTKIIKNYETVTRLGREIITHKDVVRNLALPHHLDQEFRKQDERIQKFCDATKKADKEWKKNPYSINSYWTGLS